MFHEQSPPSVIFLHCMVLRRNEYTSLCYLKERNLFFSSPLQETKNDCTQLYVFLGDIHGSDFWAHCLCSVLCGLPNCKIFLIIVALEGAGAPLSSSGIVLQLCEGVLISPLSVVISTTWLSTILVKPRRNLIHELGNISLRVAKGDKTLILRTYDTLKFLCLRMHAYVYNMIMVMCQDSSTVL